MVQVPIYYHHQNVDHSHPAMLKNQANPPLLYSMTAFDLAADLECYVKARLLGGNFASAFLVFSPLSFILLLHMLIPDGRIQVVAIPAGQTAQAGDWEMGNIITTAADRRAAQREAPIQRLLPIYNRPKPLW